MANIAWIGTNTPGDLTVGANWVDGAAPAGGDVAVFNAGVQDVDPSLGDIAALAGLEIYEGYGGAIGASGNKMTSSIDTVKHLGRAALWLDDSAGVTDDVFIRTVDRNVIVNLGGDTMTRVTVLRGNVTFDGALGVVTLLNVGFVDNVQQDVRLNIVNNGNAITDARIWGGETTLKKTVTSGYVSDGLLTLPVGSSGLLTNIYQDGGVIRHNAKTNIAAAYVGPGTLDLGQDSKTVTLLVRMPGSKVIKSDTIHTITTEFDLSEVD